MSDLSIIVLSWNTRELTLRCLAAATEAVAESGDQCRLDAEVILVDNGSKDGSAAAVARRFPDVARVELPRNLGYAAGNNAGIRRAKGRVLLLLNSDALLVRDALDRCLALFDREPRVGAAGVQLLHEDGRPQNSIHAFPSLAGEFLPRWLLELCLPNRFPSKRYVHRKPLEVEAVLGAAFFARAAAIAEVGPLDESYFFFLEETDWCWRFRAGGWMVKHVPAAQLVHLSGASSKRRHPAVTRIEYHRSLYLFLERHRGKGVRRAVAALRFARTLSTCVLLAPIASLHPRSRARLRDRLMLLRWHLQGCPPEPSLAEIAPLRSAA